MYTDACVTVGYPPTRARGKRGERRGAYIGSEWHGNDQEKALVAIHPERMKDGITAAEALFEEMYRHSFSSRRYNRNKHVLSAEWEAKLTDIVSRCGDPPPGYAKMADPNSRGQGTRLRKYVCDCYPSVIVRAATDSLQATCDACKSQFKQA